METESFLQKIESVFEKNPIPLQIHTDGYSSFLFHPDEVYLSIAFRFGFITHSKLPLETDDYRFCESILKKVSRSFALVIQTLPDNLRVSICIFYLILRALDTIEDDMVSFKDKRSSKVKLLRGFADNLTKENWSLSNIGEGDEKKLLEEFPKVLRVFHSLSKEDQVILQDISRQMGNGMADFILKDVRLGTATSSEYRLYCHYVAGLVGQGLTRLFVSHGKEDKELLDAMKEADEMGMFLQKINILRDYLEDLQEGRTFWPRDIWGKYASSLLELRTGDKKKSLACLNELAIDAFQHVPSCIRYLQKIKDPKVFKFCAIPQVMAIATLERLINNPDVFTGIVKIRKGLMLSLFQYTSTIEEVKGILSTYSDAILSSIPIEDPSRTKALSIVHEIQGLCSESIQPSKPWPSLISFFLSMSVLIYAFLQNGKRNWMDLVLLSAMLIFMFMKKCFWLYREILSTSSS